MFDTLRNAWKIPDLRKKILFTVLMLLVFRIGTHIPVPGLNPEKFKEVIGGGASLFGFLDIISGGALQQLTIFAMSITPYVNASIIMTLLQVAIPRLERLAKEGEEGKKIIGQYTRYGAVILGFIQATAIYFGMGGVIMDRGILSFVTITLTFTAGTAFLMWLGEKITEHGIGNGISLIIFGGIVSRGPQGAMALYAIFLDKVEGVSIMDIVSLVAVLAAFVVVIAAVVFVNQAERRIPIQYAKKVVGRKMVGGQSSHIPMKVNSAGVIPIIFAMSILSLPSTIIGFFFSQSTGPVVSFFKNMQESFWYAIVYGLLILFFTFFYTMIQFNPVEIANNLKKNAGFIPGIRPGKPTSDYISKVLNRITWFGGFFLAMVTIFPSIIGLFASIPNIWFSGTAVLILVGVALDTVKQLESQMLMRHYKGFLE